MTRDCHAGAVITACETVIVIRTRGAKQMHLMLAWQASRWLCLPRLCVLTSPLRRHRGGRLRRLSPLHHLPRNVSPPLPLFRRGRAENRLN